jgi:hypothetical protein
MRSWQVVSPTTSSARRRLTRKRKSLRKCSKRPNHTLRVPLRGPLRSLRNQMRAGMLHWPTMCTRKHKCLRDRRNSRSRKRPKRKLRRIKKPKRNLKRKPRWKPKRRPRMNLRRKLRKRLRKK